MAETAVRSEDKREPILHFTLRGGLLYRLEKRLGLADRRSGTILTGLIIGAFLWIVLMVLAILEGIASKLLSFSVFAGHVRLLVAIPLFFTCEAMIDPRMSIFFRMISDSEVVPANLIPGLNRTIARAARWRDSSIPEALCLLLALSFLFTSSKLRFVGVTANYSPGSVARDIGWTAGWYWVVCLTAFRFFLIRWLWWLAQWSYILWRLSRLDLQLVPTHPDSTGGLGYLEVVHSRFVPLVLGLSAVQCAALMENLADSAIVPRTAYMMIAVMLAMEAALFIGPLLVFWDKLWDCRANGLADYMVFADRYVSDFEKKWIRARPDEPILGTPDIQSLADLFNSVSVIRNMRMIPFGLRLVTSLLAAALIPAVPLLLFVYPFDMIAKRLLEIFLGV